MSGSKGSGGKEVVETRKVEGIMLGILHAKKQIVAHLVEKKIVVKGTTVAHLRWQPLLGTKNSVNLKNLGYVIGYKLAGIDEDYVKGEPGSKTHKKNLARAEYYHLRVDYDDHKLAHINYGSNESGTNFVRAVQLEFSPVEMMFRYAGNPEYAVKLAMEDMTRVHHRRGDICPLQLDTVVQKMEKQKVSSLFSLATANYEPRFYQADHGDKGDRFSSSVKVGPDKEIKRAKRN